MSEVDDSCACQTQCDPSCVNSGEHGHDVQSAPKLALGVTGGTVAACVICCVLPLAWPAIGLVVTADVIASIEVAQPWMVLAGAITVVIAWFLVWQQAQQTGRRTNPRTIWIMALSTGLLAVALYWGRIEPYLVAALIT